MNKTIYTYIPNQQDRDRVYAALDALGLETSTDRSPLAFQKRFPRVVTLGLFKGEHLDGWEVSPEKFGQLGREVPLTEFMAEATKIAFGPEPVKVRLNETYVAKITKNSVEVGCQTFEADKILEVAERIKALRT